MATRRRPKPKPKNEPNLGHLFRGEVIGGALVVIAILLMLSLLSSNRGEVTGPLVDALKKTFGGVGTWLFPLLLAALGAWLALRDVTDQRFLSTRRLLGAAGLFLAVLGFAHLVADGVDPLAIAPSGKGGGLVGRALSQTLVDALGPVVAIVMLGLLAAISLFALSGLSLAEVKERAVALWLGAKGKLRGPDGRAISPLLPAGAAGPRALWTRIAALFTLKPRATPLAPPTWQPTVRGQPTPQGGRLQGSSVPGSAPVAPQKPATPAAEGPARIVGARAPQGSAQAGWRLPMLSEVLENATEQDIQGEDLRQRAHIIETTLEGFGVPVQVVEANQGPAVTQFGLRPGIIVRRDRKGEEKRVKVRVSQIQALASDLSLALAASPIRIEAPVPGRDIVGVEVPNVQISLVSLRGVMESEQYGTGRGPLTFGLGRDVSGTAVVADLTRMPHLLIAGATGTGKSVCLNAIITALLLTHTPDSLRFLMIDPKRVELTMYNGIPHLIAPVVVDVERAVPVLQWATREMERRYKLFAKAGARNIGSYNEKLVARGETILPLIVILVDELADLMLSAPEDVERYICRIAQMARATGIHLVIATQRPSVDVVTGLIKANFPARIAFAVTSIVDSRVVLDTPGAEQLLGRGDMLYMAPDTSKLLRLQGCFVADRETQQLVRYWRGAFSGPAPSDRASREEGGIEGIPVAAGADDEPGESWTPEQESALDSENRVSELQPPWLPGQEMLQQPLWGEMGDMEADQADRDGLYVQAVGEVRKTGRASVSLLQRRLRIGYSRAARLIDQMEEDGIVGPDLGGSRGREVIAGEG